MRFIFTLRSFRAAEEGRSVLASNSASLAPLQTIIHKVLAACGDEAVQEHGPATNGHKPQTDAAIDPLLGSRIQLGF